MSVIFDSIQPVNRIHPARSFGRGLYAYTPHSGRVSYTADDEREYLELVAARESAMRAFHARRATADRAAYNQHLEDRYKRSRQTDRVSRGPLF